MKMQTEDSSPSTQLAHALNIVTLVLPEQWDHVMWKWENWDQDWEKRSTGELGNERKMRLV